MQELKDKVSYAVGLSIAESLKSQQLRCSRSNQMLFMQAQGFGTMVLLIQERAEKS